MAENQSAVTTRHNGAHHEVKGNTVIADSVVSTIAGIAARDTGGVYAMGGGMSRTIGAVRDRVAGNDDPTRGVKVEVGEKQAAIDLEIVVEYGTPISQAAGDIRSHVSDAVQGMTGLEVVEANISVLDVHIPGSDDDGDSGNSRVE
ncbi:Asp23/Gls24 family envelope stress response protein [Streptomyces sp. NBC_01317]|uniref:Asp23/Gls24 family envelope stress response protein n=1 Tax=Streptomyces sp. NBC_01317 TaxID=2903822 RepID=UPI002E109CF5|nr:Asp23/Gls24 family envelope stress response protein [Streptomyces sp. NBC_01317]